MKQKNLGFLPDLEQEHSSPEDYVLGGAGAEILGASDEVANLVWALYAWSNPVNGVYPRVEYPFNHASLGISEKSKPFLPDGTVQRGREDWMNCTSNAPCNELEVQFNYALSKGIFTETLVEWFKDVGFINPDNGKFEIADAWSSIGSGTTRQGNSLKAPLEFIRKNGIIPKSKMPDSPTMSWDEYHDKKRMTQELWDIANKFQEYIQINYEKVWSRDFIRFTKGLQWEDFDSYVDPVDGDFIKRLAPNYKLMGYAYHITIKQIGSPKPKIMKHKFYKKKGDPKIYQLGADGLYHHIVDEPVFKGLYGNFEDHEIVELDDIPQGAIGFTVYNKSSVSRLVNNLFGFKS